MPLPRLCALYKIVQPAEYTLETGICTIGRASTCHIVISYKAVSRLHAKIERDGPHYLLHDTNSANGTFVNGYRLREPHLLMNQDVIGLSTSEPLLRFEDSDPRTSFEQHAQQHPLTNSARQCSSSK